MSEFFKMVKDCLTENNGTSYCPFRVAGCALAAGGVPAFVFGAVYTTLQAKHFDYLQFGTAFGTMMTGLTVLALGIAAKAKTDTP